MPVCSTQREAKLNVLQDQAWKFTTQDNQNYYSHCSYVIYTHNCTKCFADIIFSCLWILLTIAGIAVQLTLYLIQKQKHKKRQMRYPRDPFIAGMYFRKYTGFPTRSLYRQLVNKLKRTRERNFNSAHRVRRRNNDSSRPLLAPNSGTTYGTYHVNTWPNLILCCVSVVCLHHCQYYSALYSNNV